LVGNAKVVYFLKFQIFLTEKYMEQKKNTIICRNDEKKVWFSFGLKKTPYICTPLRNL